MRGLMILAGAELIQRFSWVLYVFGAFIVYAGIHMLFVKKESIHPEKSLIFRVASKYLRITHDYKGEHFFARAGGKLLQDRQREGGGFAGAGLGDPDHVAARHDDRDGLYLDRGRNGVFFFGDCSRNRVVEAEAVEGGQIKGFPYAR